MPKTTIVIPCYNEASRLDPEPFVEFCIARPDLQLIFVDDGSTDETATVLTALASRAPDQITVVKLERNRGKAEAVREGVLRAFDSSAEFVGFWDADLATPLYNIDRFTNFFEADAVQMVVGARVGLLGHHVDRTPIRHYIGRVFATIAAIALQLSIYDTQCGAKMFRVNALSREIFANPFELGWSFDIEVFARLVRISRRTGLDPKTQIIEVPLREWVDAPGSKLRPSHFPRIAWELGQLFVIARRP